MTANDLPSPSDSTNVPEAVAATSRWKIWAICFAAAVIGAVAFEPLFGHEYGCLVGLLIGMSAVAAREIWRERSAPDAINVSVLIASLTLLAAMSMHRSSQRGYWDNMILGSYAHRQNVPDARALKALLDENGEPQAVVKISQAKGSVTLEVSNLSDRANVTELRSGMDALGIKHRSATFYRASGSLVSESL